MVVSHLSKAVSRWQVILCVLFLLWTPAAHANCTALPVISKLVIEVDRLSSLGSRPDISASVRTIHALQGSISRFELFSRLRSFGKERHFNPLLGFQAQLANLKPILEGSGAREMSRHLKTTSFQSSLQMAKRLTNELCLTEEEAQQSKFAADEFKVLEGIPASRLPTLNTRSVAWSLIGMALTLVVGLFVGGHLRKKYLEKEKRRTKRFPCNIPVLVQIEGKTSMQRLVDLSRSGANMENQLGLDIGNEVALSFGGVKRTATVTWCNSHFSGVQFGKILSNQNLTDILHNAYQADKSKEKNSPLTEAA